MRHAATSLALPFLIAFLLSACSISDPSALRDSSFISSIMNQSREIDSSANKLWEGTIDGARVSYFRSGGRNEFRNIVVVTRDHLPETYKRVSYCDINGDSELDFMDISMFDNSAGWRNVRISKRNPHAISLANGTYRRLLEEISMRRLSRLDF
jgi:hypothetical protein